MGETVTWNAADGCCALGTVESGRVARVELWDLDISFHDLGGRVTVHLAPEDQGGLASGPHEQCTPGEACQIVFSSAQRGEHTEAGSSLTVTVVAHWS